MKIHEIMTKTVECIPPTMTIGKAAQKMRDLNLGFLPICENDRLIGAVTDRDITVRSVAQGRDPRLTPVREVMTQDIFYSYDDEDVERVAQHMRGTEVRRMVILNREKRLVGVVSLGDIARAPGEKQLAGETLGEIAEAA
jgi:CBS domain-containing protein